MAKEKKGGRKKRHKKQRRKRTPAPRMNEGTFEARVSEALDRLIPSPLRLRITHQRVLSLQLGRQLIERNGLEQWNATGRLDVLLELDAQPLAVLELKRPEETITDADRAQGISYARLLNPMAPLVIISSGQETRMYQSYADEEWEPGTLDETTIAGLFETAMGAAAQDVDQAVRTLLGQVPDIWAAAVVRYTRMSLDELTGDVADLTRPLAQGFSIARAMVNKIKGMLVDGEKAIALVGAPLSGRTNVLAQLCRDESAKITCLYVDLASSKHGVLRRVANVFSREYFRSTKPDDVRQWLLHSLRSPNGSRIVFVLDGWDQASADVRAETDELLELTKESGVSFLFAMTEHVFGLATQVSGRPSATALGRALRRVDLGRLKDEEFLEAAEVLQNDYDAIFERGSQVNAEYRWPRVLRAWAGLLSGTSQSDRALAKPEVRLMRALPSVTSMDLLMNVWRKYAPGQALRHDLQELARAFLADTKEGELDPSSNILSYGRGHIHISTAEDELGQVRLDRLLEQGHLSLAEGPSGKTFVLPKVPELLAVAASYVIAEAVQKHVGKEKLYDAYQALVDDSAACPLGDLTGALAMYRLSAQGPGIPAAIFERLLGDEPTSHRAGPGTVVVSNFEGIGEVRLHFGEGMDEELTGNIHPWLILSHIAGMRVKNDDGYEENNLAILATVGSYPGVLRRPDIVPLKDMQPFHMHEIAGLGNVPCGSMGIIEPVTQSLRDCFGFIPNGIRRLCGFAVETSSFPLMWRLGQASASLLDVTNVSARKTAKAIMAMVTPAIRDALSRCHD